MKTELSREESAIHKFSTGNLESLDKPDTTKHLLEYHDRHYSANLMSLSLVGNHELDILEELALEHFSEVENKDLSLTDFSGDVMFDETAFGHLIKIVPVKDLRNLEIIWPQLPPTHQYYNGNPLSLVSHCIGHEGKNSLLSELKKQDLANSLSAGNGNRLQRAFGNFAIAIGLTEKGVANKDEVIRLVFAYINNLKSKGSPPDHLFEEIHQMRQISWEFLTRTPALAYSKSMANKLMVWNDNKEEGPADVEVEDVLYKSYLFSEKRYELVQEYLDLLTPENCLIMQRLRDFDKEEGLVEEPIYSTKYKKEPIA